MKLQLKTKIQSEIKIKTSSISKTIITLDPVYHIGYEAGREVDQDNPCISFVYVCLDICWLQQLGGRASGHQLGL